MRDRDPEQLNKKDDLVDVKELVRDAEPGPFTLDDILAEYGVKREPEPEAVPRRIESRSQPQRTEKDNVVLFPGARSAPMPEPPQAAEKENAREPEEDREPESGEDAEDQEGEDEEPNDRVVEFPEEESVLSAFLKDVTRKADHYADHMFQESEEMDQEEIHRLEKLIPGTDVEEDEPEELPGRFRRPRRPEPPPPDTAPQELARQYGKGLKVMRLRVVLVFLLARYLGQSFVDRMVSQSVTGRYLEIIRRKQDVFLALVFLFPFFPDDLICILAGLTTIPFRRFLIIALLTRPWGLLVACALGGSALSIPLWAMVLLAVGGIAVFLVCLKYGDRWENWLLERLKK